MPDTYRFTFSVTPLSETDAQAVVDDIRARFGGAPLIHVVDKRESSSSVSDVQNAFILEETIQALQNVIHEARQFVASRFPAEAPRPSALRETGQEMHEWPSAHPATERFTGAVLGPEWPRCLIDTETGRCDRVLVGGRCRIHGVRPPVEQPDTRSLGSNRTAEEMAMGHPLGFLEGP